MTHIINEHHETEKEKKRRKKQIWTRFRSNDKV